MKKDDDLEVKAGVMTVIVPIYNEGPVLNETLLKIKEFLKKNKGYEFLFVDDGSTDSSSQLLKKFVENGSKVFLVSFRKNLGKGSAIKRGVKVASGEYIAFMDGDMAYPLSHLLLLRRELKKSDLVIGCRELFKKNAENARLSRLIVGRTGNLITRKLMGIHFKDTQAGLKGFRNDIAKDLFKKQYIKGFAFDVEIIYQAIKKNYKIKEIPVRLNKDHINKPTKVNVVSDSVKMMFSLLMIKTNYLLGKYG